MYNTGNPVPSSALEDMADNAQTFDALVTKTDGTTTDRKGVNRRVFQQIIMDMGFQPLSGSFQTGATITARNQTLYDEVSHVFYAWSGVISDGGYVVPAGSTPTTAGGVGVGAWSDKTDLMLRSELNSGDGAALVGGLLYAGIRSYSGSASKIQCIGKYNIFDKCDGVFLLDSTDITSADNGGTILIDALGRRWKRAFQGVAFAEWFEGATNRLMLKNALAAKIPLQLQPNSSYVWDGTDSMEIDVGYTSLNCNSSKITFSGFTDAPTESAIKFISTLPQTPNDYWVPQNTTKPLSNLTIVGPKGTGVGAAFSSTCVGLNIDAAHLALYGVFVYGFGHGYKIGTNGYCIAAHACNIGQCANGVTAVAGGSNYGESIEFFGCKIYDNAVGINNNCPTGVIRMIGGSLDYNVKQIVGTNSSTTELTSTWFECNDAGAGKVHIDLSGGATFRMRGGHVQQNGTPGALAQAGCISTDDISVAKFKDVFIFNTKNTANVFDAGTGLCDMEGTESYSVSYLPSKISNVANNLLNDGGFATTDVSDLWSLYADTAAITNRLTGTNLSLSLSTDRANSGAKSLKALKAGGGEGAFVIVVPVEKFDRAAISLHYSIAAGSNGGTVFVSTFRAYVQGVNSNGTPNILKIDAIDTLGIGGTTAEVPFTELATGMDRRMASWSNAFVVAFNMQPFTGSLYLDDVNISTM